MKYLDFKDALEDFPVFSIRDIQKVYPKFDSRRLVEWQQKGYLEKIRRGYYTFSGNQDRGELFLYFTANKIYTPSYVSLESAFSYHGFIPEGVFTTTSITSRNTSEFNTSNGFFKYRHVKPAFYFGYQLISFGKFGVRMAEPEKVLLDYFYLNKVNTMDAMEEIRFNKQSLLQKVDMKKLDRYLGVFNSEILGERVEIFKNCIHA